MKEIPLTQGKVAYIDDIDYELISAYKWHAWNPKSNWYAYTNPGPTKNRKRFSMHRLIMNAKKGQLVDHKNGNSLDNRRDNLRFCTRGQNNMNSKIHKIGGYKGVHFCKDKGKFQVSIRLNNKQIHGGFFDAPLQAAKKYNDMAIQYHGEFARLNEIP
jgi:hypothetical protein